jgi:conjugative transposon TraN protein
MRYKWLVVKAISLFVFSIQCVVAQVSVPNTREVNPRKLGVSLNKTSNLIFPAAIKGVDRGSNSIIAQIASGGDNILQLKATTETFEQTNLSVITADGKFYSFLIDYSADPKPLNLIFTADSVVGPRMVLVPNGDLDKTRLEKVADSVGRQRVFMHRSVSNQKMQFTLTGLYLSNQLSWIALKATNRSLIPFEIEPIIVTAKDRRTRKREAMQEVVLPILYQSNPKVLPGQDSCVILIALHQFTLPTSKYLNIRVTEKNGGRIVNLKVSHGQIVRARLIRKS